MKQFVNKHIALYYIPLILTFISLKIVAQEFEIGKPFIQNFTPRNYGYESRNFSIAQDPRGILFIGNLNGILEYDSKKWRNIKVQGQPQIAISPNGNIFVGLYNDFGVLAPSDRNDLIFVSLLDEQKLIFSNIGQIKKVLAINNDEVYFCTETKLFSYSKKQIKLIDTSSVYINIFSVNDKLYVHKYETGIFIYNNEKCVRIPGGKFFSFNKVLDIIDNHKNLIIITNNPSLLFQQPNTIEFFIYENGHILRFYTTADAYIYKNKFVKAISFDNGYLAIGTARGGIVLLDKKGFVINILTKETGLNDNEITNLFITQQGELWATLGNGISRIEFPAAYTYFDETTGLNGAVFSVLRYNGTIYAATTQGVFYLTKLPMSNVNSSLSYFLPVKNINVRCFRLITINNQLYSLSNNGVYYISGNNAYLVYSGLVLSIAFSKNNKNIIYLGKINGITVVNIVNGKWNEIGKIRDFEKEIRSLLVTDDQIIWAGTNYEGVYRINISKGINQQAEIIQFKSGYGLPKEHGWIDVNNTSSGILFSTFKGIYRFDDKFSVFYRDSLLGFNFTNNNIWVYPIVEDKNKNIWYSSGIHSNYEKTTGVAYFFKDNKPYNNVSTSFYKLHNYTIESIFPDSNAIVWFGSFDGLIRLDKKMLKKDMSKYKTLIRNITIGDDSVVYYGAPTITNSMLRSNSLIPSRFPYKYNSIRFEFVTPLFDPDEKVEYKYFLEGFDEEWSNWTTIPTKEYTNLFEGEYSFKVKSRNVFAQEMQETVYSFRIAPPIYRSWIAYIIYMVVIYGFFRTITKWRNYFFAKEKHRLAQIIKEKTDELVREKERAEELIRNMLPKDTAEELKMSGHASRKKFKMVSVFFSDIQGFTKLAEEINPEVLIEELDQFFLYFDSVVERLNVEKIKTIGDAYMCAGGIPEKNRTNPIEVIMAAIEMQQYMNTLKNEHTNRKIWEVRFGIHTGPVIAGVIGSKRLTYDIWGDTVNIASRMESSSEPGQINISGMTYELVKEYFECKYRGRMPIKYKGEIDMYFVKGYLPELSINGEGKAPNEKFLTKLGLLRYSDMEEIMLSRLEKGLPKNLYYHNLKHTIDVITQVELIGKAEKVSDQEMLLLKTAALFHDTGFMVGFDEHELLSIKFAKEMLPKFFYTDEQIQIISSLIYATKLPPDPKNKLEEIMCDADLDYLGRNDFIPISQNLFREMYEYKKIKSIHEWNRLQIKFMETHKYFTNTAKQLREQNKQIQLQEIQKMI